MSHTFTMSPVQKVRKISVLLLFFLLGCIGTLLKIPSEMFSKIIQHETNSNDISKSLQFSPSLLIAEIFVKDYDSISILNTFNAMNLLL